MSDGNGKEQFYLSRYNQLWNNINRHVLNVWQSIGALIASLSIMILALKGQIDRDISVTMIIIMCGWLFAHVYDAQAWFDRNLALIEETEKFFESKPGEFHKFSRANKFKLIRHFMIQRDLGITIIVAVIIYHILSIKIPEKWQWGDLKLMLPYLTLVLVSIYTCYSRKKWQKEKSDAYGTDGK